VFIPIAYLLSILLPHGIYLILLRCQYILKKLWGLSDGFRGGSSVIDNIFALKIINKKLWEYNQSVYLFIDFQKAMGMYGRI
jgi:hypothetical protein